MRKPTEEEYRRVVHFWETDGDVTIWAGWDEAKPIFKFHHPELLIAIASYERALARMIHVVNNF